MNLSRFKGEVDVVERDDARIALGQTARLDDWDQRMSHRCRVPWTPARNAGVPDSVQFTEKTGLKSAGGRMLARGTDLTFDWSTTKILGPTCLTKSLPSRIRIGLVNRDTALNDHRIGRCGGDEPALDAVVDAGRHVEGEQPQPCR